MARTILAAIGLLLLSASTVHAQATNEPPGESERVVAAFVAALDNHDVNRAAQLISADAQVLTPQPISGRDAIAKWLDEHFPDDSIVEVSTYAANGQRVTWMTRLSETGGTLGAWAPRYLLTWDEAVVVRGQITLWSSRGLAEAMANGPRFRRAKTLEPATDPVPAPPSGAPLQAMGIGLVLALLGGVGYGVWESRRPPRQQLQGGALLRTLHERLDAQR